MSPKFRKYFDIISKNGDQANYTLIAQDCVNEIRSLFLVDIAITVKVYYNQELWDRINKKIQTQQDIIGNLGENEYSIYLKPKKGTDIEIIVLMLLEGINKMLLNFIFPDMNEPTKEYYTSLLIYERDLKIRIKNDDKNKLKENIKKIYNEDIKEISETTKEASLICPFCHEKSLEFLGLQNVGTFELKGGVPILTGKNTNIELMAYYKCTNCHRIFYATPQEMK